MCAEFRSSVVAKQKPVAPRHPPASPRNSSEITAVAVRGVNEPAAYARPTPESPHQFEARYAARPGSAAVPQRTSTFSNSPAREARPRACCRAQNPVRAILALASSLSLDKARRNRCPSDSARRSPPVPTSGRFRFNLWAIVGPVRDSGEAEHSIRAEVERDSGLIPNTIGA
jgi:hypothetical protein